MSCTQCEGDSLLDHLACCCVSLCPGLANPSTLLELFACLMFYFLYTAYHHLKVFVGFLVYCMPLQIRMQASGGLGLCPCWSLLSPLSQRLLTSAFIDHDEQLIHWLDWKQVTQTHKSTGWWISLCSEVTGCEIYTLHSTERFLVILSENQSPVELILKWNLRNNISSLKISKTCIHL